VFVISVDNQAYLNISVLGIELKEWLWTFINMALKSSYGSRKTIER